MNIEKIKAIQEILGVVPDGIWGPKSRAAFDALFAPPPTTSPSDGTKVDDRSEKIIATLLPPLHAPARQLVRQAAERGIQIRLISGTRTYAEQQKLYDQGRTEPGKIVTNAKPGSSWHNHGVAFDIGVFKDGEYVPESPAYRTVGHLGKSLGFEWGGDWASIVDEPHFQMTNGKSLAEARAMHDQGKNVFS
jgi:peptidoglycan L-alanyl-D-glutamate endopeptidase CwlK